MVMKRRKVTNVCSVCGLAVPTSPESWTLPTGEAVEIDSCQIASAIVNTSVGELEVCEACYLSGLPPRFTSDDLAEIHYQFGLDYNARGNHSRARESLERALQGRETADILAALALAADYTGDSAIAINHYKRALELDPRHFISRENLKQLQKEI